MTDTEFCTDCSCLLSLKEDTAHRQLTFYCRSCRHIQYADPNDAEKNCVERLNYNFYSKEEIDSYIVQGLGSDPTLPRDLQKQCPQCSNKGFIFFQLPERVVDDAMTLVYVCMNCTAYQIEGKTQQDKQQTQRENLPLGEETL